MTQDIAILVFLLVLNVYVFFQDSEKISSGWILFIEITVIVAVAIAVAAEVLNFFWMFLTRIINHRALKKKKMAALEAEKKDHEK